MLGRREEYPAISIHALREEGDNGLLSEHLVYKEFLSTPSARRATYLTPHQSSNRLFLSTPSARRATLALCRVVLTPPRFLSTPSARRATGCCCAGSRVSEISIHALREEGDWTAAAAW